MKATDYITERSQQLAKAADARIKIIDDLLIHIDGATSQVLTMPRQGALLAVLHDTRRNLVSTRDAAVALVAEAKELRERVQA